jgi:hypothetical protein
MLKWLGAYSIGINTVQVHAAWTYVSGGMSTSESFPALNHNKPSASCRRTDLCHTTLARTRTILHAVALLA